MAVAKRQRKEKACKNGTKENPWTGGITSGEQTCPLHGQLNLHRAGSRQGGDKCIKGGSEEGLKPLL